eukprot:3922959-Pyramimonas_sp.AAC.1
MEEKQYLKDAEFPDNAPENYYYVRTALKNTKSCTQTESMAAEATSEVDKNGLQALCGEDGILDAN